MKRAAVACLLIAANSTAAINERLAHAQPNAGYRFCTLAPGQNTDDLFIIVSFSGGGTRAAAFSYGVLQALHEQDIAWPRHTKLVDEVDVISGVSGGAFTAAYYGVFRERTFTDFPSAFLNRDVTAALKKEAKKHPIKATVHRSDLAAEYYDRAIFAHKTFADLARNDRPYIIINATDMTLGSRFEFTQDQFDAICSDLSRVRLAHAVAASSAFPLLLTPLTIKNYAGTCAYRPTALERNGPKDLLVDKARYQQAMDQRSYAATTNGHPLRRFLHLIDGGPADNIGMRAALDAMTSTDAPWSFIGPMNLGCIKKLLVIIVNAKTDPTFAHDQSASTPGLLTTGLAAAEAPLANYSFETVEAMKTAMHVRDLQRAYDKKCNEKGEVAANPDLYVVEVTFDMITDTTLHDTLSHAPTSFDLPRTTVQQLITAGHDLLLNDPRFKEFIRDITTAPPVSMTRRSECAFGCR